MGPPHDDLVSVKYAVPPVRRGAVVRRRLHDRLSASAEMPLCVVVAPAGWGKTTMLAQWAAEPQVRQRTAWLSLDQGDDEPTRFWSYALTSLCRVAPEIGARALATLSAPGVEPTVATLPVLLNDLAASGEEYILVLDDVHVLADRQLIEGLEFLITYLPSSLRIVMAGRADPPLPLGRWRGGGRMTEIRAEELAFTAAESAAMVTGVSDVELEPALEELLWRRTEGWAVGLLLAALAVRGADGGTAALAGLRGDDRHILEYFGTEVLDHLEPAQRDLLIHTSVVERLSGALCDAMLVRTRSDRILADLESSSHFVAALDQGRRWYRCHGLFRDALRRELDATDPESVPRLLTRAADWFLAQGKVDEAVRHLLVAGEGSRAMDVLRSEQAWFFEAGAAAAYLHLGEEAASAVGVADAEVFVMLAYAAVLCGRFDRVRHWCDAAEPILDRDAVSIDGWASARACLLTMSAAYGRADAEVTPVALTEGGRAVELETDPELPGYVLARAALASAHMRAGHHAEAVVLLSDAWRQPSRALLPTPALLQSAGLFAINLLEIGEVEEAGAICDEVRGPADVVEESWGDAAAASITWLRLVEGRIAFGRGDLAAARHLLRRAAELAEVWGRPVDRSAALSSLAAADLASGDREAARRTVARARDLEDSAQARAGDLRRLDVVEGRLGRGAVRAARRAGRLHEDLTDRELSILRELPGDATQREIGDHLFLSVNTVKGYTKSLYRKLGASSRQEAVARARSLGLV